MTFEDLVALHEELGSGREVARFLGVAESTLRTAMAAGRVPRTLLNGRRLPVKPAKPAEPEGAPDGAFHLEEDEAPATIVGSNPDAVDLFDQHDWSTGPLRVILTAAQNNSHVHGGFLRNLEALARDSGARLMVTCNLYASHAWHGATAPGRKRGPSKPWWDERIRPYLVNQRVRLAPRLVFAAELDVMTTARRPLSGLESYCGRSSVIVGHNTFAMHCVESRPEHYPKELHTTGSLTLPQFIARKTGQLARFHFVQGALAVEISRDGRWWVTHINAESDGSFYVYSRYYTGGECREAGRPPALVLGDIHAEAIAYQYEGVEHAFDETLDFVERIRPERLILHDLLDFNTRNHHLRYKPVEAHTRRNHTVLTDLKVAVEVLCAAGHAMGEGELVVVASNHDDAITRWINETHWQDDLVNAQTYLRVALGMLSAPRGQPVLETVLSDMVEKKKCPEDEWAIMWLGRDKSLEVAGVELGWHGDQGPSGARGSPKSFARLAVKSITAHTHTPSIVDGCYTVGLTAPLDLGYNVGPSRWMHAHCMVYPNGRRAFVWLKGGDWCAGGTEPFEARKEESWTKC